MLGAFGVTVDGDEVPPTAWPQRRSADLVKLLALEPVHRLPRDRIIDTLWPHLSAESGAANLHKAAHYARRALGSREAIVLSGGVVQLAPSAGIVTDVERLESGDDSLLGLELLPDDLYEEWSGAARERVRTVSAARLRGLGRFAEALELDPADEEAHRALIRSHAEAGDRTAAVRQFRQLREELAELGLQPSPATVQLYRAVSRGPAVQSALPLVAGETPHSRDVAVAIEQLHGQSARAGGLLFITGEHPAELLRSADALAADTAARGWHTLRVVVHDGGLVPVVTDIAEPLLDERADLMVHIGDDQQDVLAHLRRSRADGLDAARTRDLLVAVGQLLVVAARERGCALLIADLHRCGADAAELLRMLAGAARRHPLAVFATWQPSVAAAGLTEVSSALVRRGEARVLEQESGMSMTPPRTRYVRAGRRAHIGYQVIGDGPLDVVLVPGFVSNVEHYWEIPQVRRVFARIAAHARLVVWDKRGTGLSDPVASVPTLDERIADLDAVLGAVGAERVLLVGVSEGGPMSIALTAQAPERVLALALYGVAPRFMWAADHPWGWTMERGQELIAALQDHWGDGAAGDLFLPDHIADREIREAWGRFQRAGASPSMAVAVMEALVEVDVRHLLPSIKVPTLVVHRTDDSLLSVENARLMARRIPGATLVELPGRDHFPYLGEVEPLWAEIVSFITDIAARHAGEPAGAPRDDRGKPAVEPSR